MNGCVVHASGPAGFSRVGSGANTFGMHCMIIIISCFIAVDAKCMPESMCRRMHGIMFNNLLLTNTRNVHCMSLFGLDEL